MQETQTEVIETTPAPAMREINGQKAVLPNRFKFYGIEGAECLKQKCEPVAEFNDSLQNLVDTLLCTAYFYEAQGLAAPQIGVLQRVFIAKINGEYKEFINPVIVDRDGKAKRQEGCVSFPQAMAHVERAEDVVVQAHDVRGEMFTLALDDVESACVQHEIDHLDGILFIDRMSPLYRRKTLKTAAKIRRRFNLG